MSIQLFENGEFQLRITPSGDSFTVEAPGLARALGIRDSYRLVESIPNEEKGYTLSCTPGGDQRAWHVTEPGFYRAIGQRQAARVKDGAVREQVTRFQSWVYRDVLPSIRRTGSYSAAPQVPQTMGDALRLAADEHDARLAAEQKAAELAPSASAWDVLADATGDYSLREAAQILDRDPAITTGQNRLGAHLRRIGWTDRAGAPYQRHVDNGRLVRRTFSYPHPHHGADVVGTQLRITVKGLRVLRDGLGGGGQLHLIDGGAA